MEKNAIIGVIIALIVVVLAVGIGAVVYLTANQDDFSGATVLASPEELALKNTIESLQANQAKLQAELDAAKKAATQVIVPVNTSKSNPQTDSLGLLSDLSNCDSVIRSLEDDEDSLRSDVEDALGDYEDEIENLIILEKQMVVIKDKLTNNSISTSERDSLRDQEKDLKDDINSAEDDVDAAKDDFDDYLSEIQDVRSKLVDARIKCLDAIKQDLSKNTCSAAKRDAEDQVDDSKDDVSDAGDDGNSAGDDTNAIQLKITTATNNMNNVTAQVDKDQWNEEVKWLGKVKKLYKDWEDEFDDFKNDLEKVERDAKKVKNDVESECRKY